LARRIHGAEGTTDRPLRRTARGQVVGDLAVCGLRHDERAPSIDVDPCERATSSRLTVAAFAPTTRRAHL
jgi:hypothetical protein